MLPSDCLRIDFAFVSRLQLRRYHLHRVGSHLLVDLQWLLLCAFKLRPVCARVVRVMIIWGKDKGETGVIKCVVHSQNRVIVEGKSLVKKHIKQGQDHEGGIFSVEASLHVSNVQVLDPVTGKPCKIGIKYLEDGMKVRVSRGIGASGSIIPRPEILKIRSTPRPNVVGPKGTPMNLVIEHTYDAKIV